MHGSNQANQNLSSCWPCLCPGWGVALSSLPFLIRPPSSSAWEAATPLSPQHTESPYTAVSPEPESNRCGGGESGRSPPKLSLLFFWLASHLLCCISLWICSPGWAFSWLAAFLGQLSGPPVPNNCSLAAQSLRQPCHQVVWVVTAVLLTISRPSPDHRV